jgi:hypothetical protein
MAWRRYHIPINGEWIALGDAYGHDLRQFDVITFAMPLVVASKFPNTGIGFALPVTKGIFLSKRRSKLVVTKTTLSRYDSIQSSSTNCTTRQTAYLMLRSSTTTQFVNVDCERRHISTSCRTPTTKQ